MTKFSESFWNAEYCNYLGFDVLCRRLHDGKQMLKDFSEFLRQRAQAQEAYGKTLIKLAHFPGGRDELGILKLSWEAFRQQTEAIGVVHINTAIAILDEANRMLAFMDVQRDQKKCIEDNVRKHQLMLKAHFKRTMECKKTFETKCKELENLNSLISLEMTKPSYNTKELTKQKQKQAKLRQSIEYINQVYRSALERFENYRQIWEEQTELAYMKFQSLEEERIDYLRNSMWVVTNLGSAACVAEDTAYEEVRKKLEACSIATEIELFIQKRKTGNFRPVPMNIEERLRYVSDKTAASSPRSSQYTTSPPTTLRVISDNNGTTDTVENTISTNDDDSYATIDELSLDFRTEKSQFCSVAYDFEARNHEELSLKSKDVVRVLFKESAEWWAVKTSDGRKGYFPSNYLEPLT
ncbi:proline-serine-threonine phosphatase interacting protein [Chamberlinius hualienensis]